MNDLFDNKIWLAPLASYTDSVYRKICKSLGADIVMSEMISSDALIYHNPKTEILAKFDEGLSITAFIYNFSKYTETGTMKEWREIDGYDISEIRKVIESFRTLSKEDIKELVDAAGFTGKEADAKVDYILHRLNNLEQYVKWAYEDLTGYDFAGNESLTLELIRENLNPDTTIGSITERELLTVKQLYQDGGAWQEYLKDSLGKEIEAEEVVEAAPFVFPSRWVRFTRALRRWMFTGVMLIALLLPNIPLAAEAETDTAPAGIEQVIAEKEKPIKLFDGQYTLLGGKTLVPYFFADGFKSSGESTTKLDFNDKAPRGIRKSYFSQVLDNVTFFDLGLITAMSQVPEGMKQPTMDYFTSEHPLNEGIVEMANEQMLLFDIGGAPLLYLSGKGFNLLGMEDIGTGLENTSKAWAKAAIPMMTMNRTAKILYGIERPNRGSNVSYYSGHTTNAFTIFQVFESMHPWSSPVMGLWATTLGMSRMQDNMHWPTDVAVGMYPSFGTYFGRKYSDPNRDPFDWHDGRGPYRSVFTETVRDIERGYAQHDIGVSNKGPYYQLVYSPGLNRLVKLYVGESPRLSLIYRLVDGERIWAPLPDIGVSAEHIFGAEPGVAGSLIITKAFNDAQLSFNLRRAIRGEPYRLIDSYSGELFLPFGDSRQLITGAELVRGGAQGEESSRNIGLWAGLQFGPNGKAGWRVVAGWRPDEIDPSNRIFTFDLNYQFDKETGFIQDIGVGTTPDGEGVMLFFNLDVGFYHKGDVNKIMKTIADKAIEKGFDALSLGMSKVARTLNNIFAASEPVKVQDYRGMIIESIEKMQIDNISNIEVPENFDFTQPIILTTTDGREVEVSLDISNNPEAVQSKDLFMLGTITNAPPTEAGRTGFNLTLQQKAFEIGAAQLRTVIRHELNEVYATSQGMTSDEAHQYALSKQTKKETQAVEDSISLQQNIAEYINAQAGWARGNVEDLGEILEASVDKHVVIGDIHGNLKGLKQDLRDSGLIDKNDRWIGGETTLIQMGDILDRGKSSSEAMEYIYELMEQGAEIIRLLGNHELMFIQGMLGSDEMISLWLEQGGDLVVKELLDKDLYEIRKMSPNKLRRESVLQSLLSELKDDIIDGFIVASIDAGGVLFVHGGVLPGISAKRTAATVSVDLNERLEYAVKSNDFSDQIFNIGQSRGGDGVPGIFWADYYEDLLPTEGQLPYNQVVAHTPGMEKKISGETELITDDIIKKSPTGRFVKVDIGHSEVYGDNRGYLVLEEQEASAVALKRVEGRAQERIISRLKEAILRISGLVDILSEAIISRYNLLTLLSRKDILDQYGIDVSQANLTLSEDFYELAELEQALLKKGYNVDDTKLLVKTFFTADKELKEYDYQARYTIQKFLNRVDAVMEFTGRIEKETFLSNSLKGELLKSLFVIAITNNNLKLPGRRVSPKEFMDTRRGDFFALKSLIFTGMDKDLDRQIKEAVDYSLVMKNQENIDKFDEMVSLVREFATNSTFSNVPLLLEELINKVNISLENKNHYENFIAFNKLNAENIMSWELQEFYETHVDLSEATSYGMSFFEDIFNINGTVKDVFKESLKDYLKPDGEHLDFDKIFAAPNGLVSVIIRIVPAYYGAEFANYLIGNNFYKKYQDEIIKKPNEFFDKLTALGIIARENLELGLYIAENNFDLLGDETKYEDLLALTGYLNTVCYDDLKVRERVKDILAYFITNGKVDVLKIISNQAYFSVFTTLVELSNENLNFAKYITENEIFNIILNNEDHASTFADAYDILSQITDSDGKIVKHTELLKDFIDINMGCPMKKIVKNKSGAALLKDKNKIKEIVSKAFSVTSNEIPLTVKIRSGFNSDSNLLENVKIIESEGASAIIIHPRTKKEMFSGKSNWNLITKVKENSKIPIIGNGDILTPEDAKAMFYLTQCDSIMIGRGAIGNPWIFSQIKKYLQKNSYSKILPSIKIEMIMLHFEELKKKVGCIKAIHIIRKFIALYTKGMKGASYLRQKCNQTKEENQFIKYLLDFHQEVDQT